jgi:hypothetical protein
VKQLTRLGSVALVLCWTVALGAQINGPTAESEIKHAIRAWQKMTGIQVTDDAQRGVIDGFLKEGKLAGGFPTSYKDPKVSNGEETTKLEALVQHYLYNVRDTKILLTRLALPSDRLQIGGREELVKTIGLPDIQAYPVTQFITDIQPAIKGETGRLVISSEPQNAMILLDRDKHGFTNRVSIVSAGPHDIRVSHRQQNLDCRGTVDVPAGSTSYFKCP